MSAARPISLIILGQVLTAAALTGIGFLIVVGVSTGQSFITGIPFLLLLTVELAVGWILVFRLPRHPVGWMLLAIPALFTITYPVQALGDALRATQPMLGRWADWVAGNDDNPSWAWIPPVWILLSLLPLRFPDGRLPSPRWRWFSWFAIAELVITIFLVGTVEPTILGSEPNPAYIPYANDTSVLIVIGFGLLAICFIVSIASLFVRYRHAHPRERAQLRWMIWAVAIAVAGLVISWVGGAQVEWLQVWLLLLYALIPVAIAVAILRYRLYEIDRIISRTAAYALVTLIVVATYAVVVLVVTLLLPELPSVGVALATLAAAGVFLPVLRWVRHGIDRVFNRSQYDAERVVDAFGERIRNGADPQGAGDDLIGAVGQTLQPASIGLWTPEAAR